MTMVVRSIEYNTCNSEVEDNKKHYIAQRWLEIGSRK
jgi:hypothetical protein